MSEQAQDISINTANTETGEPVVVLRIKDNANALTLQNAMDIGNALIEAVAASQLLTPAIPVIPTSDKPVSLIHSRK